MIFLNRFKFSSSFDRFDYLFLSLIPFCILFFLPFNYEPGSECFNEWATARLFLDWDGFPKPSLSLGYVLYSALLINLLDYKNFILVEYFITFTFFYFCIYYLVRHWLNNFFSFLTIISCILIFYQTQGHNVIIGIGFVLIYVRQLLLARVSFILPLNLIVACTFHQAFIFTLIGHYFGSIYSLLISKKKKIFTKPNFKQRNIYLIFFKSLVFCTLIVIYSFSILNPSLRKDNNHYMDEMPWAPMKIKSSLDAGIMQMVPADYNARRISLEEAKTQDWFFTNKTIFNNAENAIDAIIKVPNVFIETITFNLRYLFTMPNAFILKWHNKPIIILSALLSIFTFLIFSINLFLKKKFVFLSSFLIGILGITIVLLLTRTSNLRYNVVFFPFLITFFFQGLYLINKILLKRYGKYFLSHLFAFLMIFGSYLQNYERYDQFTYFNWSSIFSNKDGYSYNFHTLKKLVRPNDVILTQDSNWVKGFFDISHNRIFSLNSLPPFEDNFKFKSLTKIITQFWVKPDIMSVNFKEQSTNYFLRYQNYLLPLVNFAKKENWEVIHINNFGIIYRKRKL